MTASVLQFRPREHDPRQDQFEAALARAYDAALEAEAARQGLPPRPAR